MFEQQLPAHPSIEQYKNQAKDLLRDARLGLAETLARLQRNHPRFHPLSAEKLAAEPVSLTDAQLILAREHGFLSWPKFAAHIETLRLIREVEAITDPVAAFIDVAVIPRHTGHATGTLEHAELILARYPDVATASIHTAAILADEDAVRRFLTAEPSAATAKGGPLGWDPLTHLCFSRFLRLDASRSEAFVRTAGALLDAGASANTGWTELIDQPTPRETIERAIYGVAAVAQHVELTRLLLERGADPNDEETPYHVPENYDNAVLELLLQSGKFTPASLAIILIRKADVHDFAGMKLALEHGADPNLQSRWGITALHQALRRDNQLATIALLLDHGADPALITREGFSATFIAAHRGRGDVLRLFEERQIPLGLSGPATLLAALAQGDRDGISTLLSEQPALRTQLLAYGGSLLAPFSGNGNLEGVRCLLELGVPVDALYTEGDGYFEVARNSTALHVAAWRARPAVVTELIARGADVNALDARGRTPLQLAIKAAVDSYWTDRRTPESIAALLTAGATTSNITLPTGYEEADNLLRNC